MAWGKQCNQGRINQGVGAAALLPLGKEEGGVNHGCQRQFRALPRVSAVAGVELLRTEPESQNCTCEEVATAGINFSPCTLDPKIF